MKGVENAKGSGDALPKATKSEILGHIHSFTIHNDRYPTVDDIADRLKRPRKVVADFLSRYARYGVVEPFKEQGRKTRYGPGVNWAKVDNLEWGDFFRAGVCSHCKHRGVLGLMTANIVRYRCKWCHSEWSKSRDQLSKEELGEIERQAQKTRRQWVKR